MTAKNLRIPLLLIPLILFVVTACQKAPILSDKETPLADRTTSDTSGVVLNMEDGSHTIKVIAFDASGNPGEASKEITVKNILLKAHVGEDYYPNEGLHLDNKKTKLFIGKAPSLIIYMQNLNDEALKYVLVYPVGSLVMAKKTGRCLLSRKMFF